MSSAGEKGRKLGYQRGLGPNSACGRSSRRSRENRKVKCRGRRCSGCSAMPPRWRTPETRQAQKNRRGRKPPRIAPGRLAEPAVFPDDIGSCHVLSRQRDHTSRVSPPLALKYITASAITGFIQRQWARGDLVRQPTCGVRVLVVEAGTLAGAESVPFLQFLREQTPRCPYKARVGQSA